MTMSVCVTKNTLHTQSKVYHCKTTKDHTTISPKDQIPIFTHKIYKYQQKHTIQEIYGKKCERDWERNKIHTFSWRLVKRWRRIWRFCVWTRWFWKRERQTRRWIVTRCEGKMKSFLNLSWKRPSLCKTRDFCDWNELRTSRQIEPPNTFETKFWKITAKHGDFREKIAKGAVKVFE